MNKIKLHVLVFVVLVLAGCQTAPSVSPTAAQECQVPEPVACPVCERQQCPEAEPADAVVTQYVPAPAAKRSATLPESKVQIIGEKEWALVEPGNLVLEARIDTGADTSSIHAENIQLVEKDGKRWVRFTLTDPKTGADVPLERRLHRRILVKQKTADGNDRRYVVRMWLTLGKTRTWVDVSLSDRNDFEFPLLIGRNMLMDNFAVDVSGHHTLPKPKPSTEGQ